MSSFLKSVLARFRSPFGRAQAGRAAQEEYDVHRALLFAAFHASPEAGAEAALAQVEPRSPEERKKMLQSLLLEQVRRICTGVADATAEAESLGAREVEERVRASVGFGLSTGPSGAGTGAGLGLFLHGRALPGAVVAMYPGVVYPKTDHRYIPGYPNLGGNEYLMARFDGCVLDAKPWGGGADVRREQAWTGEHGRAHWTIAEVEGSVERRNPFALAHFANHPPKGEQPNVMSVACDFAAGSPALSALRPFVPLIRFRNPTAVAPRPPSPPPRGRQRTPRSADREEEAREAAAAAEHARAEAETLPLLLFLATRELEEEELFLNYRLNPALEPPQWYHPVNLDEDRRRWA